MKIQKSNEAASQIRELHAQFLELDVWAKAKSIVNATGNDDTLFFMHPIKAPFLEIYDNLLEIAKELEGDEEKTL